jgi:hypothetical protein
LMSNHVSDSSSIRLVNEGILHTFNVCNVYGNHLQYLRIRHVIDVMHCEKNFCENLLKTLFRDDEKDYARRR